MQCIAISGHRDLQQWVLCVITNLSNTRAVTCYVLHEQHPLSPRDIAHALEALLLDQRSWTAQSVAKRTESSLEPTILAASLGHDAPLIDWKAVADQMAAALPYCQCRVVQTSFAEAAITSRDAEAVSQLLGRPRQLTRPPSGFHVDGWHSRTAVQVLVCALKHMDALGDPKLDETFEFRWCTRLPPRHFLRMNHTAACAVGIGSVRATRGYRLNSTSCKSLKSLFLPFCHTKAAKALVDQWLRYPVTEYEPELRRRHDVIEALLQPSARSIARRLSMLLVHFRAFETTIGANFNGSGCGADTISVQCFDRLGQWLQELIQLVADVRSQRDGWSGEIASLDHWLEPLTRVCEEQLPILVAFIQRRMEELSADRYASVLAITECRDEVTSLVENVSKQLLLPRSRVRVLYEDDDDTPNRVPWAIVFRVARQDAHRVAQTQSLTLLRSSKATGVLFTCRELDTLASKWRALQQRQRQGDKSLAQSLYDAFTASHATVLADIVAALTDLDVLMAFAQVSWEKQLTRPRIVSDTDDAKPSNLLRLDNAFNPLDPQSNPVPALSMQTTAPFSVVTSHDWLQVVLHSVVLNQIGCFVPCQHAELRLFSDVFLRSGTQDHQVVGLSTFMTEMVEVAKILQAATPSSLVLIDDLCRGTADDEGAALASAICSHLQAGCIPTMLVSQRLRLAQQPGEAWARYRSSFRDILEEADLASELAAKINQRLRQGRHRTQPRK